MKLLSLKHHRVARPAELGEHQRVHAVAGVVGPVRGEHAGRDGAGRGRGHELEVRSSCVRRRSAGCGPVLEGQVYLAVQDDGRLDCTPGSAGQASCPATYTPAQVGTGTQTITASYGGEAEHTASSGTATVTVTYAFSGLLAPLNNQPTVNTGKAGRIYPVKWQLQDTSGNYVSALSVVTSITYKQDACASSSPDPADALEPRRPAPPACATTPPPTSTSTTGQHQAAAATPYSSPSTAARCSPPTSSCHSPTASVTERTIRPRRGKKAGSSARAERSDLHC